VTSFLKQDQVSELLKIGRSKGAEFAEVYGEYTINTAFVLDENELRQVQYGILSGVGIRVIDGDVVGYAYATSTGCPRCAKPPRSLPRSRPRARRARSRRSRLHGQGAVRAQAARAAVLERIAEDRNRAAREHRGTGPRSAHQAGAVRLADSSKAVLVANSEGLWVEDRQFITRLGVNATAIDGTNRQAGFDTAGGAIELDYFTNVKTPEQCAQTAADTAIALLGAVDAKAGSYPVIINQGWGGVLVHECFGHSLEGDGIRKKTSIREKQFDQKVCADIVDIYDDSTVPNSRGSFKVDDEGTPSQKSHVVEKGVLKGYLWDRLNAKLTDNKSTANGRRTSYRDFPIPRMTNTYIAAGTSKPEDLFASVKNGLYCKSLGGGR
jgi:TldD protein